MTSKPLAAPPAQSPKTVVTKPAAVKPEMAKADAAPQQSPLRKNNEEARALLVKARKAMDARDFALSHKLIDQARALRPQLAWSEDNPTSLEAELTRVEGLSKKKSKAVAAVDKDQVKNADKDQLKKLSPADAKAKAAALLKQGRIELAENKLDDAIKTLDKLRVIRTVAWGLFEDSPERFRQDLQIARQKHDQEESVKVLAEARELLKQGSYAEAKRAAYRAQKLHGPYSVWDFGDRPRKVLADLELARAKAKTSPNTPAAAAASNKPTAPAATPPATTDANKAKALQLLAKVGRLENQNKLLEARQKAAEAVQLKATFKPGEESPEYALEQIAFLARQRTAKLTVHACDMVSYGAGDPVKRCDAAETELLQARELAAGFGQDVQPIDAKMTWVRQTRNVVMKQPAAAGANVAKVVPPVLPPIPSVASTVPASGPAGDPVKLTAAQKLETVRIELSRGSTATARKIAEEVYAESPALRRCDGHAPQHRRRGICSAMSRGSADV